MRFAESKGFRISFVGQAVHHRTTRITQSHHLRTFIEGFARCVVYGLPYHLHVVISIYFDDLRVTARHQQTQERERGSMIVFRRFLDKVSQYMRLQMVDLDHRDVQRCGKSFGKRGSDQQRSHQPRPARERNGAQFRLIDTCTLDSLCHHRDDILLVCA